MKKFWKEYFLFQKEPSPGWSRGQRELYYAYRVALLLCAGLCMGLALLVLAIGGACAAPDPAVTFAPRQK